MISSKVVRETFRNLFISSLTRRSFSVKPKLKDSSFTISYLVNTCGLSPKAASSASKRLNFVDTSTPDANLKFFQSHGFDQSQISKLITKRPNLLVASNDAILEPKFELLKQIGLSGPEIVKLLSSDPAFLCASLENQIIPSFNYLKTLLFTNENIAIVIKRRPRILSYNIPHSTAPKIGILQGIGVPESNICKLILRRPSIVSHNDCVFKEAVIEVKKIGFNPSSTLFFEALFLKLAMNQATWEAKNDIFKSYGFCDDDILRIFKAYPNCMASSKEKLKSGLHFFINKLHFERSYLVKYAVLLTNNLEKSIIPRWNVLECLHSKGVVDKNKISIGSILKLSEMKFADKFLIKYKKEVPELSSIYPKTF